MRFLVIIFVFSSIIGVDAQPLTAVPYETNISVAEEEMAKNEYYNARKYYGDAYEQRKSPELALKIAELNEHLRDYKKAAAWYRRVFRRDKEDKFLEYRYNYADVLKRQGKYKDALEQYNYFIERSNDDIRISRAKNDILGMKLESAMEEDISITVENAGRKLNGKAGEFSPTLDPDGTMLYSTLPATEPIVIDGKSDDVYFEIYKAEFDEKRGWQKGKALGKEINREGYHTVNPSISLDGSRMFYTRSQLEGDKVVESKAYVSLRTASGWGPAQELSGVNGDYKVLHPVSGELYGNEVLFFSSDMEGGKGGYDIYYCTRKSDTEYSLPTNLGSTINTAGDEWTPYYNNGTLYFSTDGHPSLGGFDIYSTTWDGASWSSPENMGLSYNSTYDDIYFSLNKEGNKGFLVSNRPGTTTKSLGGKTCCDDIWIVNKRALVIDLLANVFDEDGKALNGATAELFNLTNRNAEVTSKKGGEKSTIKFLLDPETAYKVVVKKKGYFPAEKELNTVGKVEDYTYKRKFVLKKMPVDPEIEIVTINEPIRLNNIYYDFDDDKILPSAEGDLGQLRDLMNQYSDMVIELSSHTDSQGGDDYNQQLSLRRAKSAKRWLVSKGIDGDRIKPVGYGEEQILNHCENGVDCTDEEHRFNRRTEFKIISGPTTIEIKKEVFKK